MGRNQTRCLPLTAVLGTMGVWGACSSPAIGGQNAAPQEPTGTGVSGLVIIGDAFFTAYYGREVELEPDAVLEEVPDIQFDAISAPITVLDGTLREVDLSIPSDWVFLHNLHYAGGVDGNQLYWHVVELQAGTDGLSGRLTVQGTTTPGTTIAGSYQVQYAGPYELPGLPGTELQLSVHSTGVAHEDVEGELE